MVHDEHTMFVTREAHIQTLMLFCVPAAAVAGMQL
jgi:hypothetical protein